MAKTLTLELADNIYEVLLKTSAQIGQTPEQIIIEWVESKIKQTVQDPLLQLAGIFPLRGRSNEADITDVSERHDEYIGAALRDTHT